jgi:spore coat polysaccharide biosynthesis predicted glycosyltransferase SpsG
MQVGIRADGGVDIGMGHLARSGTLAETLLERGHDVMLVTRTPDVAAETVPDGVTVVPVDDDGVGRLGALATDVTVLDLPEESSDEDATLDTFTLQRRLTAAVDTLVTLQDFVDRRVCCDAVVNSHVYAAVDQYEWGGDKPDFHLGLSFHIFDKTIRATALDLPPFRTPPERVVVSMGGSDVENVTPTAIRALDGFDVAVDVIVGPGFTNHDAIDRAATTVSLEVTRHGDPDDLASLMARADVAVTALGYMAYEFLALGTPIVGVVAAPDQEPKADALATEDAAEIVCRTSERRHEIEKATAKLLGDADRRRELRRRGTDLVELDGVHRVVDIVERNGRS